MHRINIARRRLMQWLGAAGGLLAVNEARAHHTDTHFDDRSTHQIVYQCNKADPDYLSSILFSVGEMIRKYGDDVEVVVANALGAQPAVPDPANALFRPGRIPGDHGSRDRH